MPAGEWMEPFTAGLIGMNGWVIVLVGSLVNLVTNKVGAAAVDILFIACVFSINTVCKGISSFCQLLSVSCWFWKESILYEEVLVKAAMRYVHLFTFSFQQSRQLNTSGCVFRFQVLQFFYSFWGSILSNHINDFCIACGVVTLSYHFSSCLLIGTCFWTVIYLRSIQV